MIEANQIVDVGDAAITLFPGRGAPQASQVRRNTIVSAGRNAAFGIFADPLGADDRTLFPDVQGDSRLNPSYAGSSVAGNTIFSGPRTSFAFGLLLGNRVTRRDSNTGTGASFTGNTLSGTVNVGIGVSGFTDVRVAGNMLNSLTLGRFRGVCPLALIAVGPPAVSSGTIQPPAPAFLPDVCL